MGYTTDFEGSIAVDPPLNEEEREFLQKFNNTRRMDRSKGPYFVDGEGFMGQANDDDVINHNSPDKSQPGLWCQWMPSDDGSTIEWDGGEKFYASVEWMQYIIAHFVGSNPAAKKELPFLQGHNCNGEIEAQGEESRDIWKLVVVDNDVSEVRGHVYFDE